MSLTYVDASAKEFIILDAQYYCHTSSNKAAPSFPMYQQHHRPLLRAFTERF